MILPKHISDELRIILQKVHDDAVSPTHDSRLGYSERALEELAHTLETEVQKAKEMYMKAGASLCYRMLLEDQKIFASKVNSEIEKCLKEESLSHNKEEV